MFRILKVLVVMSGLGLVLVIGLFIDHHWTGNFLVSERPAEAQAINDAGYFEKLKGLGIRKIERAASKEALLIELRDGTLLVDRKICAWNETVESWGYCGFYTPGSGRGYIVEVADKSFRGDPAPSHWSKELFLQHFGADVDRVIELATEANLRAARTQEARASWGDGVRK